MVDQSDNLINFKDIESRVFLEYKGGIYIGGKQITPEIKDLLHEQAKYLKTSHLWELLDATITNEAANMALIQSGNWEHVQTAKMLHHWNFVLKNMIEVLAK